MTGLTELEKAALQALAGECDYSLHGHASKENVTRHFKGHLKGNAKKALLKLKTKSYCTEVGGKKNARYKLTIRGRQKALEMLSQ